jgi:hypothetical protein
MCVALSLEYHERCDTRAKQASENSLTEIYVIVFSAVLPFLCLLSLSLFTLLFCVDLVFEPSDTAILLPRTVRHDPVRGRPLRSEVSQDGLISVRESETSARTNVVVRP